MIHAIMPLQFVDKSLQESPFNQIRRHAMSAAKFINEFRSYGLANFQFAQPYSGLKPFTPAANLDFFGAEAEKKSFLRLGERPENREIFSEPQSSSLTLANPQVCQRFEDHASFSYVF